MIRKTRNKRYNVKAYLIHNETSTMFWCTPVKYQMVTNEMGQPMANGNASIETESTAKFTMNDRVKIGSDVSLTVDDSNAKVDAKDKNAYRGNPRYIQVIKVS